MPIVTGLNTATIRDVNAALASTLFPRFMKTFFGKVCGSTRSSALVEPFAFDGASPLLKKFNGNVNGRKVNTFSLQITNPIFKNREDISRTMFEMDQTNTVRKRAAAIGVRVAQGPDYLTAKRILKGDSDTTVVFEGQTYYLTFDHVAQFSASHVLGTTTQSNIVTGNLPTTLAAMQAQDLATTVNQLHKDLEAVIDRISSIKDDKGAQLFSDFDPEQHLQIIGPPGLRAAFRLAFQTPGSIVGGSGGSTGSSGGTTNIGPSLVSEVITPGLLRGCVDIESEEEATVSPLFETQYYWNIKDDYVRGLYFQKFFPKSVSEIVGYDPETEAEKAAGAALKGMGANAPASVVAQAADLYAMTSIDHNLGAIGANAQQSVVDTEAFFMSGRTRFNVFYGPWFLMGKVDPAGQST